MRKLLFLLLLLPIGLFGQVVSTSVYFAPAAGGAPPAEIFTNTGFADATGWATGYADAGVPTITGGVASLAYSASGWCYVYQSSANLTTPIVANTAYTLMFDLTRTATIYFTARSTSAQNYIAEQTYTTNGTKTINFTTPADVGSGGFSFRFQSLGANTVTMDNVSLKLQ